MSQLAFGRFVFFLGRRWAISRSGNVCMLAPFDLYLGS